VFWDRDHRHRFRVEEHMAKSRLSTDAWGWPNDGLIATHPGNSGRACLTTYRLPRAGALQITSAMLFVRPWGHE
jgi:hypothetical protein